MPSMHEAPGTKNAEPPENGNIEVSHRGGEKKGARSIGCDEGLGGGGPRTPPPGRGGEKAGEKIDLGMEKRE